MFRKDLSCIVLLVICLAAVCSIAWLLAWHLKPNGYLYKGQLQAVPDGFGQFTAVVPCSRFVPYEIGLEFVESVQVADIGSRILGENAKINVSINYGESHRNVSRELRRIYASIDPVRVKSIVLFEIEPKFKLLCKDIVVAVRITDLHAGISARNVIGYVSRSRAP